MKNNLTPNQTKAAIILAFVSIVAIFFFLDGEQWLNLENLKQNRDALRQYTEEHYFLLFIGCGLIYILATAFSIPGATVLSLGVGFLFGRWMGTLLIVISATIGATLVFLLARYLIAEWARERLEQNEQATRIIKGFNNDAFNYMLFLRLIPLFPFWLINLAPAFTPIPVRTYITSTLIGIIPGSFVFANLGQSLGQIRSLDQLLSTPVLFAFTLLGLLALSPVLLKWHKIYQEKQELK